MPRDYTEDNDLFDVAPSILFGHAAIVAQFGYHDDRYNISVSYLTRRQFDELCKVMRSWDNVIGSGSHDDGSRTYFTYSSENYG